MAQVITLVYNNLKTHSASSIHENLPPAEAYALMKRFRSHYTPKRSSWLNIAELEFLAFARQCLARRIPDIRTFAHELEMIVKEHNKLEDKVKWQFTVENDRAKLNRHYEKVAAKTKITNH